MGKSIREFKKATSGLEEELKRALEAPPPRKPGSTGQKSATPAPQQPTPAPPADTPPPPEDHPYPYP
jgi:sec-independent protein translocase protein TatA